MEMAAIFAPAPDLARVAETDGASTLRLSQIRASGPLSGSKYGAVPVVAALQGAVIGGGLEGSIRSLRRRAYALVHFWLSAPAHGFFARSRGHSPPFERVSGHSRSLFPGNRFLGQRQRRRKGPFTFKTLVNRDKTSGRKARQLGAICTTPGNLCLYGTAWWGWEDSNFEPNDYQLLALRKGPALRVGEPMKQRQATQSSGYLCRYL
jgi:hypothetical protein